jgi:hypothetical protein
MAKYRKISIGRMSQVFPHSKLEPNAEWGSVKSNLNSNISATTTTTTNF